MWNASCAISTEVVGDMNSAFRVPDWCMRIELFPLKAGSEGGIHSGGGVGIHSSLHGLGVY